MFSAYWNCSTVLILVAVDDDHDVGVFRDFLLKARQDLLVGQLVAAVNVEQPFVVYRQHHFRHSGLELAVVLMGRATFLADICTMDRLVIMKKTSRKKIVSIIGMISILRPLKLGSLQLHREALPAAQARQDVHELSRPDLHLGDDLFDFFRQVVVADQGDDGDRQARRRGKQGFRDAAGDGVRIV